MTRDYAQIQAGRTGKRERKRGKSNGNKEIDFWRFGLKKKFGVPKEVFLPDFDMAEVLIDE